MDFIAPGQHLQRIRRTEREFTDQHGRKFFAWADKATNAPIGEFQPMGFQPPWLPPMRFAKFRRDGDLFFAWQYDSMANELAGGSQAYYQEAIEFALQHNKPEPEVGGPVHHSILFAKGKPPLSPAIPLSAKEGDPWILGVPDAPVNEVLKEVLHQGIGSTNRTALDYIRKSLRARMEGIVRVPEVVHATDDGPAKARTIHDVDVTDVAVMLNVKFPEFSAQYAAAAKRKGEVATAGEIGRAWQEHKALVAEMNADAAA